MLAPIANFGLCADDMRISQSDSVEIHFHQSKWNLDRNLGGNGVVLDSINRKLTFVQGDSIYQIRHVDVTGAASPEGSESFNRFLSEKRAETLFNHFSKYGKLSDADRSFTYKGRDWQRVLDMVEDDPKVPYRDETITLLRNIIDTKTRLGRDPKDALPRLKKLRGGVPYSYLYKNIFPAVRASRLVVDYSRRLLPSITSESLENLVLCHIDSMLRLDESILNQIDSAAPEIMEQLSVRKPFYMDIRTNMLYDAVLLPNLGAEFYLGKDISLGGNWMYAWWSKNSSHFYMRAYGGELFGRWWFGKKAHAKPLTGHHLGAYAQIYTYDFEFGGDGEMGGKPGGTLWDKFMWGGGLEYGFSLPIGSRFNIDFSLGIGYSTGLYHKYKPSDTHYVWQSTHRRHYFGPTKVEIALVWLIGRDNVNRRKSLSDIIDESLPDITPADVVPSPTGFDMSPTGIDLISTERKEVPHE
ncbi:MAG: DUF3575 domain-containing protein [Muribaculum sp.]|nr:DUF3575 domain-containing protein [Muribaculum sp.]